MSDFTAWFYSVPHRKKYDENTPVYLAALEGWRAGRESKMSQRECYQRGHKAGRAQGRREGMEEAAEIVEARIDAHTRSEIWYILKNAANTIRKAIKQDDTDE